jgi:hypothetical protein
MIWYLKLGIKLVLFETQKAVLPPLGLQHGLLVRLGDAPPPVKTFISNSTESQYHFISKSTES